jgi:membrane-bound ClpP family serine protease
MFRNSVFGIRRILPFLGLLFPAVIFPIAAARALDKPGKVETVDGRYIFVRNPINSDVVNRVKTETEHFLLDHPDRRGLKIVYDFNPEGYPSSTSDYGACSDLARYILRQQDITTIAFVHVKEAEARKEIPVAVTGHTVLPVLACKEIVMSKEAKIGDAWHDQNGAPDPDQRQFYETVANSRGRYPAIVLKMLDKDVEVVAGSRKGAVWYIDKRRQKEEAANGFQATGPVAGLGAGSRGIFSATQAESKFRLCNLICETPQEVIEAYALPPHSLRGDPLQGRPPIAWRIVISGRLDKGLYDKMERRIRRTRGQGANFIIFQLECGGGDPTVARDLGDLFRTLKDDRGENPVKTVAYVTRHAHDLAIFLALGCTEIVMDSQAKLGDFQDLMAARPKEAQFEIESSLRELAQEQGYSPVLIAGMVNSEIGIYRVRNQKGRFEKVLVDDKELEEDRRGPNKWADPEPIKKPGQWFSLDAALARDLHASQHTFDGQAKEALPNLYNFYGLDQVHDASSDWLEEVAEFLRWRAVSIILIMIGIGGLILELKLPGSTLPAVVAAVCFVLYFWAHSQLAGHLTWLAVMLFLLGLVLIGVEIFILPGLGVTGISGVVLMIVGLALVAVAKKPETTQEWLELGSTTLSLSLALVGAVGGAMVLAWYLPHMPLARRLVLAPTPEGSELLAEETASATEANAALLGAVGVAATPLRPAGKVRFGDDFVDVVAEGSYIEAGTRVQVIEIEGNRIVVKEV